MDSINIVKDNLKSLLTLELSKPTTQEELQSQAIIWLRFPLALLVILIHINPQTRDIFTPIQTIDFCHITVANIYSILGRTGYYFSQIAVPFFFFVSGYYFFFNLKEWNFQCYKKKIKKRLKTLLIPYLLWNLISLLFMILNEYLRLLFKPKDQLIDYITNINIGSVFWNFTTWNEGNVNLFGWIPQMYGPYLLPLWFLRELIIISFVLTPIIYYGIKYFNLYWVILLGIIYLLNICPYPGINITGIFFFSLGAYLSLHNKNIVFSFNRHIFIYGFIALFSLIICVIFDSSYITLLFQSIYCITAIAFIVPFIAKLIIRKKLKIYPKLSQTSFFIYALHPIIILKFSCLGFAMYLTNKIFLSAYFTIGYILSYITVPLLCATLCLIIFILLKIFTPHLLNLLTGNRN